MLRRVMSRCDTYLVRGQREQPSCYYSGLHYSGLRLRTLHSYHRSVSDENSAIALDVKIIVLIVIVGMLGRCVWERPECEPRHHIYNVQTFT
jgi:hypothetical protein